MAPLAARLLLAAAPLALAGPAYPVPPPRTATQARVIAEKDAEARAASEAARPQVLKFFGSQLFRDAVRECCPEAARLSPEALLQQFRAEVQAAEYAHAFPLQAGAAKTPGHHFSVQVGEEYKFLLNSYQCKIVNGNGTAAGAQLLGSLVPPVNVGALAEEQIFGLPPFANSLQPTWEEAADRLNYVALNLRRLNFGSVPTFGDATIIFDNDIVKDMILSAPIDTGLWEMFCNSTVPPFPKPINWNCSAWDPSRTVVGTWDHFDHLILQNLHVWQTKQINGTVWTKMVDEVRALFGRSGFADDYLGVPNVSAWDTMKYWESNVVGNVPFPAGVRFLIGSFGSLFGTANGRVLQRFADAFGWPLVWAFTEFMGDPMRDPSTMGIRKYHLTGRVVDPTAAGSKALNASFDATAAESFERLWAVAAASRAANRTTEGKIMDWWHMLHASQVPVAPSSARLCGDSQSCIGYDVRSNACVCRKAGAVGDAAIII